MEKKSSLFSLRFIYRVWTKEDKDKVKEVKVFIGAEDKEAKKVLVKNAMFNCLFRVDSGFLEDFPKEANDWKEQEEEDKEEKKKEKNASPLNY